NLQRAIQIAQYFGFWIVIDYHGNTDLTGGPSCWLNFWAPVTQQFKSSYSKIIWEPLNEPNGTSVSILSSDYQMWINQDRNQGDNHWIVIQNICSYDCNLCPEGDGSCSAAVYGYPTVTDPLGTLAQGGRIFISLHSYMDYSGYSSSWNNATAESVASGYYATVLAGVAQTGWPALNTEGGTDPLCSGICAPDTNLSGSAGYTTTTLHFIQTLTSLYDDAPQRISWVWWPAGSWTNTTNAGIYGAMQCASRPVGWGCLLNIKSVSNVQPLGANFSFTPVNPDVGTTITFNATASSGTFPYIFTWAFGDGSTGAGSFATHAYSSAGTFNVILTVSDSGSPKQTATSQQTVAVTRLPPSLATSFSYSPLSPETGQHVEFTGSASGGAAPYAFNWSFADGSVATGNPSLHTYTSSGSYNVTVTVTDANGNVSYSSQAVTVAAVPTVSFTYGPMAPETSSLVTFNARTTGGVGSFTFSWSFGDGNLSVINPASHTYSTPGSFTVTLTATDSDGVNASSSQVIIVVPALSVGFANSPATPEADQPVNFTATQSGGVGIVSLSWDFGDNSSSTENPTSHIYT
ncbi:MAG TPA: PKD domain-containing protein, partial [Ktedonobacteraceae bacterium]|nr:PKD domain-containing protein [Ktedonobacteraceae bacterium]